MKYGKEKNEQTYEACCSILLVTDEPCDPVRRKVINQKSPKGIKSTLDPVEILISQNSIAPASPSGWIT